MPPAVRKAAATLCGNATQRVELVSTAQMLGQLGPAASRG